MANQAILIINSCSDCPYSKAVHLSLFCSCDVSTPIFVTNIFRWSDHADIPDWCPKLINNKIIINKPKKLKKL